MIAADGCLRQDACVGPLWATAGLCHAFLGCLCYAALLNDRLEQKDLINYQIDLHQILRVGRYAAVDVQFGTRFTIGELALPWHTILGAKSVEIGDMPSFLGLAFHNGWQDGKADGSVNTDHVLPTSRKNLLNFGPLTPEFTMIIWQPFTRQMGEIGETRSLAFQNRWQEQLNGFVPNSH